jgi:hypothetical protein
MTTAFGVPLETVSKMATLMTELAWLLSFSEKRVWIQKRRWHVAINPLEKHSVHGVGGHSMDVHDMGMLGEGVYFGFGCTPCTCGRKKHNFSSAVKIAIFDAHFREKTPSTYHKIIFKSDLSDTSSKKKTVDSYHLKTLFVLARHSLYN